MFLWYFITLSSVVRWAWVFLRKQFTSDLTTVTYGDKLN